MKRIEKLPLKSSLILGIPLIIAACSSARDDGGGVPPTIGGKEPGTSQPGPQPEFGQLVQQKEAPPPISGGTLAASKTSSIAVAADSDRDRVYVVDLANLSVKHNIELPHKSEPGRVALDASNQAHVALRNTGDLVTINLDTGATTTRKACGAPRGVTFDASSNQIFVACATGDLVIFPSDATKGEASRLPFGKDLRDVIMSGKTVYMTRFRTAQIVPVTNLASGKQGPSQQLGGNLAWRAIAAPPADPGSGEQQETPAVVAQDPSAEPVRPEPGGYGQTSSGLGSSCGDVGIVSTRLFLLGDQGGSVRLPSAVLPVDLATNGREFVVVAAGNSHTKALPQLFVVHRDQLRGTQECVTTVQGSVPGQAISAGFDVKDQLIVQTREPAALHIMSPDRRRVFKTIVLSNDSKEDTGHAIFHANAGGNLACASCHAEGMDDGKTWEFVGMGPRRTPSLLGTTPGTEPFHWSGDMKDLSTLVDHVFVERMSGPKIAKDQVDTLGHFIFTLPPPAKLRAVTDVPARGAELFAQRCATCHTGSILTNNKTVDVGTGGEFQVPSLVGVAWRGPFLHTGCATTLTDRFDPTCGGDKHGDTKDLTADQIQDIVKYLESL